MTPTAEELINSNKFWRKRIDEQSEYLQTYKLATSTRDDKDEVWYSALVILDRCQFYYLSTYILDQIVDIIPDEEVRRIFDEHVHLWNALPFENKIARYIANTDIRVIRTPTGYRIAE